MKKFAPYILLLALMVSCDHRPILGPEPPPEPIEDGALFVCFDDGFETWDWAVDILDSLEMKGNFFVHPLWLYDDHPPSARCPLKSQDATGMDWEDARRYRDLGHSVLSHAWNNKPVPSDSLSIAMSYQSIASNDMDTTCFSFPNSRSDSATISYVAIYHQVARLCSVRLALQDHFGPGEYDLKGIMVYADTSVMRYKSLLADAQAEGKVVILVFHNLCDGPDCGLTWMVHIDKFRGIVEYADAIGLRAWTFADYLADE